MSSISFYSSFVTSLLSGRFGRLPLLLSLKRAAVAEPVIIWALFSGFQRQPGLGGAPLWGTAGSRGRRVTPQTLLCRGPLLPVAWLRDVKGQGQALLPYLSFCLGCGQMILEAISWKATESRPSSCYCAHYLTAWGWG